MRLSYAQNLEDVHLNLLFSDVERGIYVDVGGGHPIADNVTLHAYLKGWRGLVVEPQAALAAAHSALRPRDVVVSCLAGKAQGSATFHMVDGLHGLSSSMPANAERARQMGAATRVETKAVERLSDLIDRAQLGPTLHVLKIDVEGAEADVIAGLDFERHRPQVIVVEAVNPNNLQADASAFEPEILWHGYKFVFFDNLNRFYVADEAAHLMQRLPKTPVPWCDVGHLWDWGRASQRGDHPDRKLADVLIAGLFAELPKLLGDHPTVLRALIQRGLSAVAAPGVTAPALADLYGTGEQPAPPPSAATVDDLLQSDAFRAALGRIACMYDGGHLLE
jgi:FkbM family methyltransferase